MEKVTIQKKLSVSKKKGAAHKSGAASIQRYLNRELSWLQFNRRVLAESENPENPLLERLKFMAIFESNLDEFYMVRVSGLIEQSESGVQDLSPDGLSPAEQLADVSVAASEQRSAAARIWHDHLLPQLADEGVHLVQYSSLNPESRGDIEAFFDREVFPLSTPLILSPAPSLPFISNRSLNLAVLLMDDDGGRRLARVKVPDILKRLVPVPGRRSTYVLLEDVLRHNLQKLFPGVEILGAYLFRVVRDADIEIRELEAGDLIEGIEETLRLRRFGDPVLLEIEASATKEVHELLMRLHKLEESDTFVIDGPVGLSFLWEIAGLDRRRLKFGAFTPNTNDAISEGKLFKTIASGDVLVHHPYDSFKPVEDFVASAYLDPNVIGIKQTLYRVGAESPIVESLLEAAEEGKQVAVAVELKARFDESNNLVWARALERAGAHVTYGFPELKVHSKLALIVRREGSSIRTYGHIGTGNYNPSTAKLYTDVGLFTSDAEITQDILNVFNLLTGFSKQREFKKLLVSPINLRDGVISRIQREIEVHKKRGGGRIIFKLNALVDTEIIDALYEASDAGVHVDLLIRGICCLRPGVPGLSANIKVCSLVGRFLEHSRVLYFGNGGSPEVYIGSADLMPRNLDRRVEVLAPLQSKAHLTHMRDVILKAYLKDNTNTWDMQSDGRYVRRSVPEGGKEVSAQVSLMRRS
ncbi:MAG TPA: polyphosphate kinase 1 [Fimbriimonadaceae bacterium]|nr:polyphosphate kinase 1 [Fimbriimonadaceae bacterium]